MKEQSIQNLIRIKLSSLGVMNFRNNTGMGWAGEVIKINSSRVIQVHAGDVVVKNARPLHAGLCEGSSDIIGVAPIVITEEMVGQTLGVFVGAEVKTKTGRVSKKQQIFIDNIKSVGGIAGVVRCEGDAEELIKED